MQYISLFSGIGGFERGFEEACNHRPNVRDGGSQLQGFGSDTTKQSLGATCVGFSEIDKYAIQIYRKHFPDHPYLGDITNIDPSTLPDIDLICGGFPCQAFSIAGKRRGFEDTRGTLFFEICRLAEAKRPRLLLLENVKGLLSHDNNLTFRTIIRTLDELGYDLQWQVLNSKNFGVPQNRERVFIVGHLRGTPRPEVFPFRSEGEDSIQESTATHPTIIGSSQRHAAVTTNGIVPTLSTAMGNGGGQTPMVAHTVRTSGKGSGLDDRRNWDTYQFNGQIRRLTPTECERLQGFPDGWTEGVSDTQRYKCLGNAVTVNVIKAIAERLLK